MGIRTSMSIGLGKLIKLGPKRAFEKWISALIFSRTHSVESFWKLAHFLKSSRWITGSQPEDELRNLQFSEIENLVQKILIVGVGSGETANYLHLAGYSVSVLDISEVALRHVNQSVIKYSTSDYLKIPPNEFDLVLHHLVAQHMINSDLIDQLEVLYRSLKKGGEIRIQLASSLVEARNDLKVTFEDIKKGSVLRSERAIVDLAQGITSDFEVRHLYDFPQWEEGWRWYLLVIRKL